MAMTGFDNLVTIGGDMLFRYNSGLASLHGLNQLTPVVGDAVGRQ
jgi:hypothetical protein